MVVKPGTCVRKKNCFGCRAYWYDELMGHCTLHYEVKEVMLLGGSITVPQEECPKPRTYRELLVAKDKRSSQQ